MKMVIRFKNGDKVDFECDDWEIKKNTITGELVSTSFKNVRGKQLIYFRACDIDYIYKIPEGNQ